MFYKGSRKTLPGSIYGVTIDILETTGWTYDEYLAQPADLIDEMEIRMIAKSKAYAQAEANKSIAQAQAEIRRAAAVAVEQSVSWWRAKWSEWAWETNACGCASRGSSQRSAAGR